MIPPTDWEIKKCLHIVIAILLATLGLIGSAALGYDIPVLRQIVCFIFLTSVPGILILRILKMHQLGSIRTLLYSVGLSLAFLMFVGLFMNAVYPHLGVSKPLSTVPVIISISVLVLVMCFFAYKRDHDFAGLAPSRATEISLSTILFSIFLPLLSIIGTRWLSQSGNNSLLLLLIGLISASIIGIVLFRNRGLETSYPLIIGSFSLSLVIMTILAFTQVPTGGDIPCELYYLRLTIANSWWDPGVQDPLNTMVGGVTIVPAIYCNILNISEVWAPKVIYPLFVVLTPLGLYQIYSEQVYSEKASKPVAFLAPCFLMTHFLFIGSMLLSGSRLMSANLFVVLLMLVMLAKEKDLPNRVLLIIFSAGLILSHYATSYVWMIYIFLFYLLTLLVNKYLFREKSTQAITIISVFLFIAMCFAWYIYTAGSCTFGSLVNFGYAVGTNLSSFFAPEMYSIQVKAATGMVTLIPVREIKLYIYLATILFVIVGFISSAVRYLRYRKLDFGKDYSLSSLVFMAVMAASVMLPEASINYAPSRAYILSLFFLSPFFVLGGHTIFKLLSWPFKHMRERALPNLMFVAVFLVIHFIFQIGVVESMVGAPTTPFILADTGISHDTRVAYPSDDIAAQWLGSNMDRTGLIFRDAGGAAMLLLSYPVADRVIGEFCDASQTPYHRRIFCIELEEIRRGKFWNAYVFLGHANVKGGNVIKYDEQGTRYYFPTSIVKESLYDYYFIYNSGQGEIWYYPLP